MAGLSHDGDGDVDGGRVELRDRYRFARVVGKMLAQHSKSVFIRVEASGLGAVNENVNDVVVFPFGSAKPERDRASVSVFLARHVQYSPPCECNHFTHLILANQREK
jgi:hypothetical protein